MITRPSIRIRLPECTHLPNPVPMSAHSRRASMFFSQRGVWWSQHGQTRRNAAGASGSWRAASRRDLGVSSIGPLWQMPAHSIRSTVLVSSSVRTRGQAVQSSFSWVRCGSLSTPLCAAAGRPLKGAWKRPRQLQRVKVCGREDDTAVAKAWCVYPRTRANGDLGARRHSPLALLRVFTGVRAFTIQVQRHMGSGWSRRGPRLR
jgi:hypothetical protein